MDISSNSQESRSLHSFEIFYNIAEGLVGGGLQRSSRQGLGNDVIEKLSQMQIKHYNFIQLEILQLDKGIRSKTGKFSQQEIALMLIKAKSIMEEMEKLCSQLKVFFIFQLFEKVMICLTIVASLNYHDKPSDSSEATLIFGKKKAHQPATNQSRLVKQSVNQQPLGQARIHKREKVEIMTSAAIKKRLMGGISLYNEDYRRHVENQAGVGRFLDIFKVSDEKKKFWIQLESEFKETVGILDSTKENSKRASIFGYEEGGKAGECVKKLTKKSISCSQQEKARIVEQSKGINAQFGLNPNIFDYEIQTKDISVQKFENVIESLTEISRGQKMLTLQSIKKLLEQVRSIYEQKLQHLGSAIKKQEGEIRNLEGRFEEKLLNHKTMGSQTYPCKELETLNDENIKLKAAIVTNAETIKGLESALSKQNVSILQFERLGYDNNRRLEQQNRRILEFQRQCKLLQKNMKHGGKSKQNQKQVAFIDRTNDEESRIIQERNKILAKMKEQIVIPEYDQVTHRNTKALNLNSNEDGVFLDRKIESIKVSATKKQLFLSANTHTGLKYARSEKIIRFDCNLKEGDSIKQQLVEDYWQNKRSQKSLKGDKKTGKSKSISKSIHDISEDLQSNVVEIHHTNKSIRFDMNILDKSESDYHKSSRSKSIKSLKLITSRFKQDKDDKAQKIDSHGLQVECDSQKKDHGIYQMQEKPIIFHSKKIGSSGNIAQSQFDQKNSRSKCLGLCPLQYAFTIGPVNRRQDKANFKNYDLTQNKKNSEFENSKYSTHPDNLSQDEAFQNTKIVLKTLKSKKEILKRKVVNTNIEPNQEQANNNRSYESNSVHLHHPPHFNMKSSYTNLHSVDSVNFIKRTSNLRNKNSEVILEERLEGAKSGCIDWKDDQNTLESNNKRESNLTFSKTKKGLWNLQGWRFDSLHLNGDESANTNFQEKKESELKVFPSMKADVPRNQSVEILKRKKGLKASPDFSHMNQTSPEKFFKSQRNSFKNLNSLVSHSRDQTVGKEKGKERKKKNGVIKDYYVNRKLLRTNKLTVSLDNSTICEGL